MDGDEQEENLSAASRAIKKQLAARTVEVSAATCDDILRAALSLRSDQTGYRGLGEEGKERESAHACACPGTREEDRESPRPRPRAFLLGPSCTFSRRTSHAYKTVTCIEQAWAPSLVSDGAGRPSAGARLSRADATGGWIYRYIDAGPRGRPGGRPRHRGQLPTAPAPLPEQTCARCSGRTCSGQLAALSAVDAGVPTTRSLNAAPAGGWRSADGLQPAAGSRPGVFHVRGRPPAAGQVDGGGRGRVRLP